MRKFLFVSALMLLATFSASAARIICADNSGLPCIVSNGPGTNDKEGDVENAIDLANGTDPFVDLELYGKSDSNAGWFTPNPIVGQSGTWSVNDGTLIQYITIKAANEFKVVFVGGASSGSWDTLDMLNNGGNQPRVSHISFWVGGDNGPGPVVPEPSTFALLGAGLAGVVAIARKRA